MREDAEGTEVFMLKKVAFTMYPVKDAARARAFYEGTLGLVRGSHDAKGHWTEYDLPGGGCLALFGAGDGEPSATAGGTIAFEVEDLDGAIARLKGKGVMFRSELIHSPVCRMAVIVDSEGNGILLHELKRRL
jgi:predicted enzyme related to lactoylglutathione lyase